MQIARRFLGAGIAVLGAGALSIILFLFVGAALPIWTMMAMGGLGYAVDKIEFRVALSVIFVGLAAHIAYLLVLRRKENMTLAAVGGRPLGDRTPDESWRWGMFYHNSDDPALFVEARTGPGYTMNFGRLDTWVIPVAIVAILILPFLLR